TGLQPEGLCHEIRFFRGTLFRELVCVDVQVVLAKEALVPNALLSHSVLRVRAGATGPTLNRSCARWHIRCEHSGLIPAVRATSSCSPSTSVVGESRPYTGNPNRLEG